MEVGCLVFRQWGNPCESSSPARGSVSLMAFVIPYPSRLRVFGCKLTKILNLEVSLI